MSTPFASIDAATIAALNKGEESALEAIFRANHAALIERAAERLKDETAAAPRLVVAVMRELWNERAAIKSGAEVEGFCNEEFRNRARAVRSRMAAVHRFEKSEGVKAHAAHEPPTVDQLWAEVQKAIHQAPVDPETAAKNRRAHAGHDAASHIGRVAGPRNWKGPAALIVFFGFVLVGAYMWMSKSSKVAVVTQALLANDAQQVNTRPGQQGSLALPDSTQVRIGAESRLTRTANFGREFRAATVQGTASFTVAPRAEMPLEVRMGEASLKMPSGEFAVRDYTDEPARYVLARADGLLIKQGKNERTLTAGQAVVLARDSTMRDATADEVAFAFGWLDGKLLVKDVAVRDAMKALYRWYALDIAIRDSTLMDRKVSLDVPLESSQAAISAMESAGQLKFEWEEKRMTFRDAAPRR